MHACNTRLSVTRGSGAEYDAPTLSLLSADARHRFGRIKCTLHTAPCTLHTAPCTLHPAQPALPTLSIPGHECPRRLSATERGKTPVWCLYEALFRGMPSPV